MACTSGGERLASDTALHANVRGNLTAVGSAGVVCVVVVQWSAEKHSPKADSHPFGCVPSHLQPAGDLLGEAPGPHATVPYTNKMSRSCTTQASMKPLTASSTPKRPLWLLLSVLPPHPLLLMLSQASVWFIQKALWPLSSFQGLVF